MRRLVAEISVGLVVLGAGAISWALRTVSRAETAPITDRRPP